MKLKNSTDFPTPFLRRMVGWCCRELGLSVAVVTEARFTHCAALYRGRAWYWLGGGRILVRINRPGMPYDGIYPCTGRRNSRSPEFTLADRVEALLKVTAHELAHIERRQRMVPWSNNEADTDRQALLVLAGFRAKRAALESEWSACVAAEAPPQKPSVVERRAAKATADLERWTRKLKLAQTKVKKLKRRVAYYAKRPAGA